MTTSINSKINTNTTNMYVISLFYAPLKTHTAHQNLITPSSLRALYKTK